MGTLTRTPWFLLQLAPPPLQLPQGAALLGIHGRPRRADALPSVPPLLNCAVHVEGALQLRDQARQLLEALRGVCAAPNPKIAASRI